MEALAHAWRHLDVEELDLAYVDGLEVLGDYVVVPVGDVGDARVDDRPRGREEVAKADALGSEALRDARGADG